MGGLVKNLFGGAKTPAPAPAPVAPTVDNSAAELEAAAEARRQAALRGRSSTVLNGGTGLQETGPTSTAKLLGS